MSLENFGVSGTALDATNAGLLLVDKAVWFPALAGNTFGSTFTLPSSDDITSIIDFGPAGITLPPSSFYDINRLYSGTAGSVTRINSTGLCQFFWWDGALLSLTSIAIPPGTRWFAATLDGDDGAGGADVRFWIGTDGLAWTQLGPTQAFGTTTTMEGWTGAQNIVSSSTTGDRQIAGTRFANSIGAGGIPTAPGGNTLEWSMDDVGIDPAATSFVATSGQTITVNRGTTAPITTLAPFPVLVNPDNTDIAIEIAVDSFDYTWTVGSDMVLAFVGEKGKVPAAFFPRAIRMHGTGSIEYGTMASPTPSEGWSIARRDSADADTDFSPSVTGFDGELIAIFAVFDAALDAHRIVLFDVGGLLESTSAVAGDWVTETDFDSMTFMRHTPGTFSAVMFRHGVGIAPTDDQLTDIAAYLLQDYIA